MSSARRICANRVEYLCAPCRRISCLWFMIALFTSQISCSEKNTQPFQRYIPYRGSSLRPSYFLFVNRPDPFFSVWDNINCQQKKHCWLPTPGDPIMVLLSSFLIMLLFPEEGSTSYKVSSYSASLVGGWVSVCCLPTAWDDSDGLTIFQCWWYLYLTGSWMQRGYTVWEFYSIFKRLFSCDSW